MELTTFATNEPNEGRVDNVLIEVRPKSPSKVLEHVVLHIETVRTLKAQEIGRNRLFHLNKGCAANTSCAGCVVTNDVLLFRRAFVCHDLGYARDENSRLLL